ncbi:MAG: pantoate--beta-alanine ligase [Deltaproteobacteria bacterium]|nr:pantoate--beta-alanine ligase [Deltaproteobacteria bacterium]MBW2082514.1 pantoate--beta-alanine ligase [Deltaproteobacteria bacterium]HDM09566.1 pantoate--beta-alanine ligase [Desulfobacteraceae bacterium]
MDVIETVREMQATAESLRQGGQTIALVPTMGYLHEAHLELMRVGKRHADKLVISIFVNPTQFGPSEDFNRYPRDPEGDLDKAKSVGVDIVFMPPVEEMYPHGFQTTVSVSQLSQHLCGLSRPGHFDGVATVVCKLFNITKPHIAIFGQKDYQQLSIISRMVMDLNMDIQIIGVPTVREPDGLAMSSRNAYLSQDQRPSALCLKQSLDLASRLVEEGHQKASDIKKAVEDLIRSHPYTKIDYVSICDPVTLEEIDHVEKSTLLALAVKVGQTRLIDNCILEVKE